MRERSSFKSLLCAGPRFFLPFFLTLFLDAHSAGARETRPGVAGLAVQRAIRNLGALSRRAAQTPLVAQPPVAAPGPMPRPPRRASTRRPVVPPPAAASPSRPLSPAAVPLPPLLVSSFPALGDNGAAIPPDTHGAVGLNHLMVTLNTEVRVQTRDGADAATVALGGFWNGFFDVRPFDPKVLYDPMADRWMFTVCADPRAATSSVLIGVTQTSDPTGNWNLYRIDADPDDIAWADYPSMGFNKNWIVVQVNMFTVSDDSFTRSNIYAFDKADLYAGGSGLFTLFQDVSGGFSQTPAITFDDTLSTLYLVEEWNGNDNGTGRLRITAVTGPVGAETYVPDVAFPGVAEPWDDAPPVDNFAPQLGTAEKIMNNDARMQDTVYRNGSLWCAHTVFLPAGGAVRSAVQWWELSTDGAVVQHGRIDDPGGGLFYAFPTIAVNENNDVLIGYSRFSASQHASGNYAFRAASDPPNTLQEDTVLKEGEAPYFKTSGTGKNRWGDYSNTVVDPANDLDMWTIQEYAALPAAGSDRWGTWWGRLAPQTPAPVIAVDPSALDFAAVDVETSADRTLVVHNPGTGGLAVTGITKTSPLLSLDRTAFTLAAGDSIKITVTFSADTTGGVRDTLAIASNDAARPVVNVPVTAFGVRRGDVTDDGSVTVLDIILFVRILLAKATAPPPDSFRFHTADANGDGALNILDVVRQVNIILSRPAKPLAVAALAVAPPTPARPVAVRLGVLQRLPSGQSVVPVLFDTDGPVAGAQLTFTFDAASLEVGALRLAGRAGGMALQSATVNGIVWAVIYSLTGDHLPAGAGPVLLIPVTASVTAPGATPATFTLSQVMLAGPQAQALPEAVGVNTVRVSPGPSAFSLSAARPNPFNPNTTIAYEVPRRSHVRLVVYNVLGREVVRLVDEEKAPGRYTVTWRGTNAQGRGVASGVYLYRITSDSGYSRTRRMLLLK